MPVLGLNQEPQNYLSSISACSPGGPDPAKNRIKEGLLFAFPGKRTYIISPQVTVNK